MLKSCCRSVILLYLLTAEWQQRSSESWMVGNEGPHLRQQQEDHGGEQAQDGNVVVERVAGPTMQATKVSVALVAWNGATGGSPNSRLAEEDLLHLWLPHHGKSLLQEETKVSRRMGSMCRSLPFRGRAAKALQLTWRWIINKPGKKEVWRGLPLPSSSLCMSNSWRLAAQAQQSARTSKSRCRPWRRQSCPKRSLCMSKF